MYLKIFTKTWEAEASLVAIIPFYFKNRAEHQIHLNSQVQLRKVRPIDAEISQNVGSSDPTAQVHYGKPNASKTKHYDHQIERDAPN
jgi:hypothetical protein